MFHPIFTIPGAHQTYLAIFPAHKGKLRGAEHWIKHVGDHFEGDWGCFDGHADRVSGHGVECVKVDKPFLILSCVFSFC